MIVIDPRICPQDHECPLVRICPTEAISQEKVELPKVDQKKCIECMACVKKCPLKAVRRE